MASSRAGVESRRLERAQRSPRWASSAPVSPSRTQRRSWMPVRVRIHSSLVSMSWESSSLVTTRSGTAKPVPRNRAAGHRVRWWGEGGDGHRVYRRRAHAPQRAQIQTSQATVSAPFIPRQVSQTTPTGVSHAGQPLSARSRWRSTTRDEPKPVEAVEQRPAERGGRRAAAPAAPSDSTPCWWRPSRGCRWRRPRSARSPVPARSRCRAAGADISLALGEALTISKPSAPAASSESSRSRW